MKTYLEGKIGSSIGVLGSLGLIFGLAIPNFYHGVQVLSDSTLTPDAITFLHDDYMRQGTGSLIFGMVGLVISLIYVHQYFYAEPANDRRKEEQEKQKWLEYDETTRLKAELEQKEKLRKKAEEDQKRLEREEAYRAEQELALEEKRRENTPEMKEQREREAQAAFEECKQELERTLRHARNRAARELELNELRMKIRDTDLEIRSALKVPPVKEDPLAAVHLNDQKINQIALQAVTRIGSLPLSQQSQAWTEWQDDLLEKYDQLVMSEIVMCAERLLG